MDAETKFKYGKVLFDIALFQRFEQGWPNTQELIDDFDSYLQVTLGIEQNKFPELLNKMREEGYLERIQMTWAITESGQKLLREYVDHLHSLAI